MRHRGHAPGHVALCRRRRSPRARRSRAWSSSVRTRPSGSSSLTDWITTGTAIRKMIRSTSMTSTSGVVLMSDIGVCLRRNLRQRSSPLRAILSSLSSPTRQSAPGGCRGRATARGPGMSHQLRGLHAAGLAGRGRAVGRRGGLGRRSLGRQRPCDGRANRAVRRQEAEHVVREGRQVLLRSSCCDAAASCRQAPPEPRRRDRARS